jgi:carbon storage regulator
MLVLSRKTGQRILIGDKIAVTVVRIAPGVVRLGIEAPEDQAIIREELHRTRVEMRRFASGKRAIT